MKKERLMMFHLRKRLKSVHSLLRLKYCKKLKLNDILFCNFYLFRKANIFQENPLSDDGGFRVINERYEKARIEKKLKDLINFKGYNSSNKLKDLDKLLIEFKKNEELPKLRFDIETRNNKDTFDKFERVSRDSFGSGFSKNLNSFGNMNMYISNKEYILETYETGTAS
jgi:hypothetical protein